MTLKPIVHIMKEYGTREIIRHGYKEWVQALGTAYGVFTKPYISMLLNFEIKDESQYQPSLYFTHSYLFVWSKVEYSSARGQNMIWNGK